MIGDPVPVRVLMVRRIDNLSPALCRQLGLEQSICSVGLIATDCDDATYLALDEATKRANVAVVYGKSHYAGAANASTAYAGEVIGILAGPTPSEVEGALQAAVGFLEQGNGFRTANDEGSVVYLAHCVCRSGTYLSQLAGIRPGQALSYLVAPPVEAMVGLDAALKASDVTLKTFFAPPTETNFAGGLLTGSQSACQAACEAFAAAVRAAAANPMETGGMENGIVRRSEIQTGSS